LLMVHGQQLIHGQLMVQGSLLMVHGQHWYMVNLWFRVHC